MSKIKYKDLNKTGVALRECLGQIPNDSDGKVDFFKLLEIIKCFCDEAMTEDQAALFSSAISSTLYPAMEKRGGLLSESELKNKLKKISKLRKDKYCRLQILLGFLIDVSLFEVEQNILIGCNKIKALLVSIVPVPTSPFNDEDAYL